MISHNLRGQRTCWAAVARSSAGSKAAGIAVGGGAVGFGKDRRTSGRLSGEALW